MNNTIQVCKRGVWDETIPGISFDAQGISNYAHMFDALVSTYPRGEKGQQQWEQRIHQIKEKGKNNPYDCIIGVSGGTDSCYLLHLAKQYGLRPLAVNLDNGWNSEISVKNIKKITAALSIDLETYVINYEEIRDLMCSYMKAGMPWVDLPTDLAIKAVLYKIASREKVSFILRGNDFRSEGTQPREWTYGDGKQLRYIQKKFGQVPLKTFPNYTLFNLVYYGYVKGIKSVYPFYYIDYNKNKAQEFLKETYGWEYYGGHHFENIFTKFSIAYWLPLKFKIDKRKITLSAQILSGEISREEALAHLQTHQTEEELAQIKTYVLKKLQFTAQEFDAIMQAPNKNYLDYPSYYPVIQRFTKIAKPLLSLVLVHKPMALFQIEMRDKK